MAGMAAAVRERWIPLSPPHLTTRIGNMDDPRGSHKFKILICSGKVVSKRLQCKNVLEISTSHAQMLQALRTLRLL